MGRYCTYTPELGKEIVELSASRMTIKEVAKSVGINETTLVYWSTDQSLKLPNGTDFFSAYARARQVKWELMAEDLIDISDDSGTDYTIGKNGKEKLNGEAIERAKLKINTRQWVLAKRVPKTFGDKIDVSGLPASQTSNVTNLLMLPIGDRIKALRQHAVTEVKVEEVL